MLLIIMSLIDRVDLAGGCQAAGVAIAVHRLGGVCRLARDRIGE
jgi:hypothetical protein